jgi:hypothetical protein
MVFVKAEPQSQVQLSASPWPVRRVFASFVVGLVEVSDFISDCYRREASGRHPGGGECLAFPIRITTGYGMLRPGWIERRLKEDDRPNDWKEREAHPFHLDQAKPDRAIAKKRTR